MFTVSGAGRSRTCALRPPAGCEQQRGAGAGPGRESCRDRAEVGMQPAGAPGTFGLREPQVEQGGRQCGWLDLEQGGDVGEVEKFPFVQRQR